MVKRQAVFITPDDIIITDIMATDTGVSFNMYIRAPATTQAVLPIATVEEAIEVIHILIIIVTCMY